MQSKHPLIDPAVPPSKSNRIVVALFKPAASLVCCVAAARLQEVAGTSAGAIDSFKSAGAAWQDGMILAGPLPARSELARFA